MLLEPIHRDRDVVSSNAVLRSDVYQSYPVNVRFFKLISHSL